MSASVVLIDFFAVMLFIAGFAMTFRQKMVRRLLHSKALRDPDDEDATTYALRVAGAMLMAFGIALGLFFTTFAHSTP